ncbi:uncharacterized protein N7484_004540 [Penicillium longicatenatum]|uniref:uncharacterized protein n=1 Tax=Penicillium longicatenatum TaxID=1561947 RepID=UPI0025468E61|nr:uncharacterized protein N7484_004540 [Penicillium longicatenatum]KAJ5650817.1 hypothetical protein N7484_004540 [Penicillium longicatenatum]
MGRVEKHSSRSERSRPVSCLFCRSRKLRCSRQFPCPNCTSRGLPCQLDGPAKAVNNVEKLPDALTSTFQLDVLERLRRLEDIVIEKKEPGGAGEQVSPPRPWQKAYPTPLNAETTPATDVEWLEGEVTYPVSTVSLLASDIEFKTCTIKQAFAAAAPFAECGFESPCATKCIWLPFYEESKLMVDKYLTDITYIHHVVHTPSVRKLVDELYQNLNHKASVKIGHVSLLLAILASTTFFWTERDMHLPLFSSVKEANEQATIWMKLALEVLEYSRLKGSDSLEDIQAMIIVAFLITNLVGITSQAWYVFSTAITVARHLQLHRIDHPHNAISGVYRQDTIHAEIGRRVWWYLVGTDWQFSSFTGPQKGTYSVNPRHMATEKPLNIDDEDLLDGAIGARPVDQPTSMSYCLQRIRLAELCREITDSIPFSEPELVIRDYKKLRHIDVQICNITNEMPRFFSLDYDASELPETDPRKKAGIIIQRYVINSLINTLRCRLHLPYLSRVATDPDLAFSREACLQAARTAIRTERLLSKELIPFVLARLKFSGVLHCVCMAIIVLLMDVCLNKSLQPDEDRERREEIFHAFKILEEAKDQSPFAERILESFHAVLWKNRVTLPETSGKTDQMENGNQLSPSALSTGSTFITAFSGDGAENNRLDPTLPTFDDIWQKFDSNVDPTLVFDWDSLFAELDSPFLSI